MRKLKLFLMCGVFLAAGVVPSSAGKLVPKIATGLVVGTVAGLAGRVAVRKVIQVTPDLLRAASFCSARHLTGELRHLLKDPGFIGGLVASYLSDVENKTRIGLVDEQVSHAHDAFGKAKKVSPGERVAVDTEFANPKFKKGLRTKVAGMLGLDSYPKSTWTPPPKPGDIVGPRTRAFDLHHLVPRGYGGTNAVPNMHPAEYPKVHLRQIHGDGAPLQTLLRCIRAKGRA